MNRFCANYNNDVFFLIGQTIRFTVTFDVTREAGRYNRIIADIRRQVAMPNRYIANVPVLNPEEENRNIWFEIILIANGSRITLRIRYGDMYLIGFKTSSGQWYEFNDNIEHFDGSILLPWKSDYPNERDVHEAVTVGRYSLINAIERLANYNPQNGQENHNALYCLMTMFPEALRYTSIENFVYERIHRSRDDPIGVQLVNQVKNWGSLSGEMRRSDLFATFDELAALGIGNAQDAAVILGLILLSTKTPRPPRAINAVREVITKGRELVEIFWVQILNIDNENPGDLYGTIHVVDGLATPQYIFSQDRSSPLSIRPKVRLYV
jgi:Ribosome inactivating protein